MSKLKGPVAATGHTCSSPKFVSSTTLIGFNHGRTSSIPYFSSRDSEKICCDDVCLRKAFRSFSVQKAKSSRSTSVHTHVFKTWTRDHRRTEMISVASVLGLIRNIIIAPSGQRYPPPPRRACSAQEAPRVPKKKNCRLGPMSSKMDCRGSQNDSQGK